VLGQNLPSDPTHRLGVDIGGTFTDAILIDESTGHVQISKVPSTPDDPSRGFLNAVTRILEEAVVAPEALSYVVHATTVATNSIIEGKLAPTGFITTDGFRDLLEIQRQIRASIYDVHFQKPPPLVPRHRCFGVPERLDASGEVVKPLDESAVHSAARELREEGVQSIAVCLLHSYVNADHEKRIGQILREYFPAEAISLSSEVAPDFREYFRACTTVINAGIQPIVGRYLERIESRLREMGVTASLLLMQSSGGVYTFGTGAEKPVYMVESGPAAGVIASGYLGDKLERPDLMSFDMGGTTAKAGLIQDGIPRITKEYEVGAAASASDHGGKGSGYPIRTPVIDLVEIGAGGGSIAWIDSGEILRVGPQSAGADPGPVCYGAGGTAPTITDANLVLGRIDPEYFLGGEISLDVDSARRAIEEECGRPLGMGTTEVAHGIVEIANAAMAGALRRISIQRGFDPRDFALVAFGGAGPLHANRLAAELQIPTVIVPRSPGTFSAMGLLATDLKHEYSATSVQRFDSMTPADLISVFNDLGKQGQAALAREGVPSRDMRFEKLVDLRYVGQSYELAIHVNDEDFSADEMRRLNDEFHAEHRRVYGFNAPEEPIEAVNLRLSAMGNISKPALQNAEPGHSPDHARKSDRDIYFSETGTSVACPVFDRYELGAGCTIEGPVVIEEMDSTTLVHPGYTLCVDPFGNLVIEQA
jgi:N-methylhydantoinase A